MAQQSKTPIGDIFDHGLSMMDDGRLDIEFHEHHPFFNELIDHLEKIPQAGHGILEPLSFALDERKPFHLQLNIVIQVVGSLGDIQPFVALAKALQKSRHRVRLATHLKFRTIIKENGLEFFDIGGDPEKLMAFMVQNSGVMPGLRTIKSGAIRQRRQDMKAIFTGCWRSCFETGEGTRVHQIPSNRTTNATDDCARPFVADVIIANPPGFAHFSCAEKLGIPLHMMFTMPWSPTHSFPHPLANVRSKFEQASVANFASYALVEIMLWDGLGDLINEFRKKDLKLDPLDVMRAPTLLHKLKIPYSYLWSPALLPKPDDWPENIDICGFQFLISESNYAVPPKLQDFLDAGKPPICVGFGSIVVDDPLKLTNIIFEAVRQTGQRAIILKGWSNIGGSDAEIPENIFVVNECPHDWLFPRVSCVIHHGGAGTTAAGLLAGCPTVIIPFFGDQAFWGSIVARAGAGPRPVSYKQLTTAKLANAIRIALDASTKRNAEHIGKKMRMKNGVQNAVMSFHNRLDSDKLCCSLCPQKPAVWWFRHSHLKLSAFAATVLVKSGQIDPHQLVMYRPREYDTSRDPRGPLSACVEVLYGLIANIVGGMARTPGQLLSIILGNQPMKKSDRTPIREWAVSHFAESLARAEGVAQCEASGNPANERICQLARQDYEHPRPQGGNSANTVSALSHPETGTNHPLFDRGRLLMQPGAAKSSIKERAIGAGYYTRMMATNLLDFVLILPADISLSLTKGFHNVPKLYHDSTVRGIPTIRSLRSGVRAAGIEFAVECYDGASGIFTQPVYAFQQSGSRGLIPGIGKGLGGAFFKPLTGIFGLAGFPLHGLHRSLRNIVSGSKLQEIIQSRIAQGIEEARDATNEERQSVINRWHDVHRQRHNR